MTLTRAIALSALLSGVAGAQQVVCKPGSDSNEAKMLAFFAAPIAFSPAGNAAPLRSGEVRLSFDATYVPEPGKDITSPEKCYRNDKTENTQLSPVFPRPRVAVGLGGGFSLEATYLPPITVMDATPNLVAVALGYGRALGARGMSLLVRGHATVGQVEGPITCSPDVIQTGNPAGSCYATDPSDDTYKPNMFGIEGALGFGGTSKLQTYLGAGFTQLRPRFKVGFVDAANNVDNTEIEVDLTRVVAFAGGAYRVNSRVALTAELYSVPQDVTTVRVGGSWVLRGGR
ncbi:MAG: hypothetical protein ACT4P7_01805 [Gemmatimonadaceae bacterium]